MHTSSTTTTPEASVGSPILEYVTPHDVFGALAGGGSIYVQEYPGGDIAQAAVIAERDADRDDGDASLVLSLAHDGVGGAPIDTVWFHRDQCDRLAMIARARAALDAAEAALRAAGVRD